MIPIIFNNEFTAENVNSLLKEISHWINETEFEVIIYMESVGGSWSAYRSLLDYMNKNRARITLTVTGEVCSVAFDLAYNYKGKTEILKGSYGLVHKLHTKVSTSKLNNPVAYSTKIVQNIEKYNFKYSFLTKEEQERFDKGEDIFVDYKTMKKVCKS